MNMTMTKISSAIVLIGLTMTVPLASANNSSAETERSQVVVEVADLNLAHPRGIETLYQRLQNASREVCGDPSVQATGSARNSQQIRSCYDTAMSNAIEKLDLPAIKTLHNG